MKNKDKDKDLVKLIAQELIDQEDNKEIKCIESYLIGFSKGLKKMVRFMMMNILSTAKDEKIELPKELEKLWEEIQAKEKDREN